MAQSKKKDQRQNRRVSSEMPIRFHVIDEEGELGKFHRTRTTNISVRGVAFISPLHIHIDSMIRVEITLPTGGDTLECEAKVMRVVRELPDEAGVEYGVLFDEETFKDASRLEEFVKSIDIVPLLETMVKQGATDLHLTLDTRPIFRVRRKLVPAGKNRLTAKILESLVLGMLSSERRDRFARDKELYFPFMIPGVGRWRGSVFSQRGTIEATLHRIDLYVPSIVDLGLPDVIRQLALREGGLVAVTGSTGSGKSTTMAAMMRAINDELEKVVVSLEDPIQYIHQNNKSIIKQREVGTDTHSFDAGMSNVMRQDPDVIVLDEVPNAEVMEQVLRAAETGHMVIAGFSTHDAPSTIRNIVRMYPAERKARVLHALSTSLQGIVSQRIVPSIDRSELILIPEVVVLNEAIRSAIWTDKAEQIPDIMLSASGSITIDSSLKNLILRGVLDFDRASQIARDPDGLRRAVAV